MHSEKKSPLAEQVAQLCSQLSAGDLSALGRLFDLTAARLVRYAETLSGRREDAEDAVQVAMIQLAQRPECLAKADQPWAYFIRMVRNETLRLAESRRGRSKLLEVFRSWTRPKFWLLANDDDEWREQVQTAVKRLPQEQAEVVVLKIWEEMTFAEIADVLGESPNTAASRYRYALEKLSRLLQPLADEVHHG